jgi:hypothetical protein
MTRPSTDWQEKTSPNDDARYAHFAEVLSRVQQERNARYGKGRALHRKQLLGLQGELEILDGLPDMKLS